MIDCVSISNNHCFAGNPLLQQHQLRYKEVIQKERWDDLYMFDGMEFDQYDNLATEYFVARNDNGEALGVTRSYPTTIPYMLQDVFPHFFYNEFVSDYSVFEASRLVLDRDKLNKEERISVVDQLLVAYMERGLERGVNSYIGFMLPKIWESTFLRIGWNVEWLGPEVQLPQTNYSVRAGLMSVSEAMNSIIRDKTNIYNNVLNYGEVTNRHIPEVAAYSNFYQEIETAAA
jgi:N-acyl-L-homoserine lactone synthetase